MKKLFIAVMITLGLSPHVTAESKAVDPLQATGNVYKLVSENDRVRVIEAVFEPKQKIGLHSHPDHLSVVIEGGKLRVTGLDGKSADYDLTAGQVLYLTAQTHAAENIGSTRIKIETIELKESASTPKK